jgi:hypothetical protein
LLFTRIAIRVLLTGIRTKSASICFAKDNSAI